jgi:uncharacterized protein DUF6527
MNQVTAKLRRDESGYDHWCPGCQEMHHLPDSWKFDGNLESPTFRPSFKHSILKRVFVNGEWTGEWQRDALGNTIPATCHYNLIAGELQFCGDSTHALAGKKVPLPDLPAAMCNGQKSESGLIQKEGQ